MTAETSNSRLSFPQIGNAPERTFGAPAVPVGRVNVCNGRHAASRRIRCSMPACSRPTRRCRRLVKNSRSAKIRMAGVGRCAGGSLQSESCRTPRLRDKDARIPADCRESCGRGASSFMPGRRSVAGFGPAALEVMRARRGWRLRTSGCWPQIRRSRSAEREDQLHLWSSGHDQDACGAR